MRPIQAKIEDGIAGRITESQIHVKLNVVGSKWSSPEEVFAEEVFPEEHRNHMRLGP